MHSELPPWLTQLRQTKITGPVLSDVRSRNGTTLGLEPAAARDAIHWGQAEFDEPWVSSAGGICLSPDDLVLLYAYWNQKGHLHELTAAFRLLFGETPPAGGPIVVDLGCGPFTGGLAIAGVLGPSCAFDYIGMDRSQRMRQFGEALAVAATRLEDVPPINRAWVANLSDVSWCHAPGWRPVVVIASYLLASPTLRIDALVDALGQLLDRLGHGGVTVLYTNATGPNANRRYPDFRTALERHGFSERAADTGKIDAAATERSLRYALLHRPRRDTLAL